MHVNVHLASLLCLSIVSKALPTPGDRSISQRADANHAVAAAWIAGPPKRVKRSPEDADDAVAYAWVVGAADKIKRAAEDADDAVAYAWAIGAPEA